MTNKIPNELLKIYKIIYEDFYNTVLEENEIVITTNTDDLLDFNIKNLIAIS